MKLYEFTFNDNTNLPESEVLALAQESLKEEALLQGWAPNFNLHQPQKAQQLPEGEIEYSFEVDGEYLADGQSGEGHEGQKSDSIKSDLVKDIEKLQEQLIKAEELINRIGMLSMGELAYTAEFTEKVNMMVRQYLKTEQTFEQFVPRLKGK